MSLYLPLVRLETDEERGLTPEVCSRREFELLFYEYCSCALARSWVNDKLVFTDVKLPDLDHTVYDLQALSDKAHAVHIKEQCRVMRRERALDVREGINPSAYGYLWSPMTQSEGFGYESPVDGWLVCQGEAPALLYRASDIGALGGSITTWLEFFAATPMPTGWPNPKDYPKLIVPFAMEKLKRTVSGRMSHVGRRMRRPR